MTFAEDRRKHGRLYSAHRARKGKSKYWLIVVVTAELRTPPYLWFDRALYRWNGTYGPDPNHQQYVLVFDGRDETLQEIGACAGGAA